MRGILRYALVAFNARCDGAYFGLLCFRHLLMSRVVLSFRLICGCINLCVCVCVCVYTQSATCVYIMCECVCVCACACIAVVQMAHSGAGRRAQACRSLRRHTDHRERQSIHGEDNRGCHQARHEVSSSNSCW